MNARVRLLLSIGLPILLIIAVVTAFLLQQQRNNTTTSSTAVTPAATPWKGPITTMSLALDWTPNTNHTGIYVALAKGWYHDQGIDLRLLPYSDSTTPACLV